MADLYLLMESGFCEGFYSSATGYNGASTTLEGCRAEAEADAGVVSFVWSQAGDPNPCRHSYACTLELAGTDIALWRGYYKVRPAALPTSGATLIAPAMAFLF